MNLQVQGFDLPLKHRFTIAHQSREVQETLIVRLEDEGLYGLGESTTNPFYGITLDNMLDALENCHPEVVLLSTEPYPFKKTDFAYFQGIFPDAEIALVSGEEFSWYGVRNIL